MVSKVREDDVSDGWGGSSGGRRDGQILDTLKGFPEG